MAVIKTGSGGSDQATVGATSKALYVELLDSAGGILKNKKTYAFSGAFTPPATPTDLVTVFGSASKTVRVHSFKIGTQNTAAGSQRFVLSKRSAVTTGGTPVAATAIPLDSGDAAVTATVNHYTAAPTAGTALGNINTRTVASPAVTPATWAGVNTTDNEVEMLPIVGVDQVKPVTLRGVAEGLAISFAGAALVAGQIHTYTVIVSEE